jgi:hypothetical protein
VNELRPGLARPRKKLVESYCEALGRLFCADKTGLIVVDWRQGSWCESDVDVTHIDINVPNIQCSLIVLGAADAY